MSRHSGSSAANAYYETEYSDFLAAIVEDIRRARELIDRCKDDYHALRSLRRHLARRLHPDVMHGELAPDAADFFKYLNGCIDRAKPQS